jgi:hypothetical protein
MGEKKKCIQENLKERECLRDLGVDGRLISKWVLSNVMGEVMEGYGMY